MRLQTKFSPFQILCAWSVHFLTASGIIAGFLSILAIENRDWRSAMFWLIICLIIDGVDGSLAKLCRVREVLPFMNGKNIDYVIDFATYAIIPTYFFYAAGLVTAAWQLPLSCLMLLTAAIYYGKEGMVAEDQYFVGFPVLWNLTIFYLFFVFNFPPWGNAAMIILLSILHFIPVRIAYPSHSKGFKLPNIIVTIIAIIAMLGVVYCFPNSYTFLSIILLICLGYFTMLMVWESWIIYKK